MVKKKTPLFAFSIKFHELYCLVDKNDPSKVIEGDENRKVLTDIILHVIPHPEPEIEKSGHQWAIINIIQRNRVKLLL